MNAQAEQMQCYVEELLMAVEGWRYPGRVLKMDPQPEGRSAGMRAMIEAPSA